MSYRAKSKMDQSLAKDPERSTGTHQWFWQHPHANTSKKVMEYVNSNYERSGKMGKKEALRNQEGTEPRRSRRKGRRVLKQRFSSSLGEDHGEAGCAPAARGSPCQSRVQPTEHSLLKLLQPIERSSHQSRFAGRTCGPWGTHTGAACSWI